MRPQYREPFFQKLFIHDCPRCGEHLYCDVTVGPGLSVGTAADGTAELTIHAKATPQQHLCAGVSSAPTDSSGGGEMAWEREQNRATGISPSDAGTDWRGIHNDEGAELLREVVMERKWSTESWMRAKAWAAEGENQASDPTAERVASHRRWEQEAMERASADDASNASRHHIWKQGSHDQMDYCTRCGADQDSAKGRLWCPGVSQAVDVAPSSHDVGKDAKDRAHRAAGGVLNRAGHDYFPESDLWRAVEAALKRFEEVHSNGTPSGESV